MNNRKRLVIYFHYDPRGKVEESCRLAVCAMKKVSQAIFFVTNGCLDEESRTWTAENADKARERENVGFDVGAYKEVLLSLGRDGLTAYDEVVLMNYTLAGPVCDVAPMMDAMAEKASLDFWGITRHYAMRSRRFKTEYGEVPEHIQSHFIAMRPRLFLSDMFWKYWQEMRLPTSYEQSVALHEAHFTRYFADQGFAWDTYVDTSELSRYFVNPIMACPVTLMKDQNLPFFKRRSFFTPFADELRRTDGRSAQELYLYLKQHTNYPIDMLVSELLQTQPLAALANNLHWHYLLPDTMVKSAGTVRFLDATDLERPLSLEPDKIYCLMQPAMFTGTAGWYERKTADRDCIENATELFANNPKLGVAGPALPMHHPCRTQKAHLWKKSLPAIKALMKQNNITVPLDEENPLPVPNGGYLLLRGSAFPQGLPEMRGNESYWLLPLIAQQNGMYSATVEAASQCAARADICAVYENDKTIGQAAVELARTVKHKIQGNGDNS